ncbi:MAG: Rieske 2Fe-2S domain-containing protein [Planctomycetota bacterium]
MTSLHPAPKPSPSVSQDDRGTPPVSVDLSVQGTATSRVFANPDMLVRSWYVVAKSKPLRIDHPLSVEAIGRRLVLWRKTDGSVTALDARCPHLGADLGQGQIIDGALRCPFHHWRFDSAGRCVDTPDEDPLPDRCAKTYPAVDAHGLIWVYNGQDPAFELPVSPNSGERCEFRRWLPPSQSIGCHPHLVVGNGLDARHFGALHGMEVAATPRFEALDDHRLRLHLCGRPSSRWLRRFIGSHRQDITATFTTNGSNLAWAEVTQPLPLHVLFTGRPEPGNRCVTQTVFYLPKGYGLREIRAVVLMMSLLHSDRQILERLDFHRGFTDADEPFQRFVERVDAMEVES